MLGDGDEIEAEHDIERWDSADEAHDLAAVLDSMPACEAVGHRIVHGGNQFRDAVRVDAGIEAALLSLSSLAPLHQPRAVAGIRIMAQLRPDLPQVACFDTAFHASMPAAAATYALPRSGASSGACGASASTASRTRTRRDAPRSSSAAPTTAS